MEIIQTPLLRLKIRKIKWNMIFQKLLRLKIKNWMKYFKNNISRVNFEILKNLF